MSCPDWNRLVAERDAAPPAASLAASPAGAPDAWERALTHLDGCPGCGPRALAADPTLLFRRLPAPEVGAADVEAMRRAVESMRRAGRVAAGVGAEPGGRAAASSRLRRLRLPAAPGGWRQLAAAAALAAASFGLWLSAPDEAGRAADPLLATGVVPAAAAPSAEDLAAEPMFLDLTEPRAADMYQVGEEDLLVVMVMDETLDV